MDGFDAARARSLLDEAKQEKVPLDGAGLAYAFQGTLEEMAVAFFNAPGDFRFLERLHVAMDLVGSFPVEVDLWRVQNLYYAMLEQAHPVFRKKAEDGEASAQEWVRSFEALGAKLLFRVG